MKLVLKDFQEDAAAALAQGIRLARGDVTTGNTNGWALVLSAPTGAGKTVIVTSLMERIAHGDSGEAGRAETTFLWVTDQPELNEQTRRKIEASTDVFDEVSLRTIEAATFPDARVLEPGVTYFLNTQRLGRNSSLVKRGDTRQFTLWETIANTALERPGDFWLILDEAHRGMNRGADDKEARSIVQRLIKGDAAVGIAPIPLVLGISATPGRFTSLLEDTTRTVRPHDVPIDQVRASGLLKESIRLHHTNESQPSDLSLLAGAARRFREYEDAWTAHSSAEGLPMVRPVLVIQVADGSEKRLTRTPMDSVVKVITDELGALPPSEVAHCFDDEVTHTFGSTVIPYAAPSTIQDSDLRVVFFKMALTTGWDCPRAEVMMSFRAAKDDTLIAQLVGRMVRTPLARRVTDGDMLNAVSLYLPYYDEDELNRVIAKLSAPDPDNGIAGTPVEPGDLLEAHVRSPAATDAFVLAETLPIDRVAKISRQKGVRRLLRLGRRLAGDGIDRNALNAYKQLLINTLDDQYTRFASDPAFKRHLLEAGRIDVRSVDVAVGDDTATNEQLEQIPVVAQNVEDAFAEAGRRLGGGLHSMWATNQAVVRGTAELSLIKRELYALTEDRDVVATIEKVAEDTCNEALMHHQSGINQLSDADIDDYRQIRRQAASPVPELWMLPTTADLPAAGTAWEKHMFIRKDSAPFQCVTNRWEAEVLSAEIQRDDVVAWLRNPVRKPWGFSVAYELQGEDRPMYPDFLIFRRDGGVIVCDILEPHSLDFADSAAKARGLARFAKNNGHRFGRIEMITHASGSDLKRLNVNDPALQATVLMAKDAEQLKQIFLSL